MKGPYHVVQESHDDYRFRTIANREKKNSGISMMIGFGIITLGFVAFSYNLWIGLTCLVAGGYLVYSGIKRNNQISNLENRRRRGEHLPKKDLEAVGMGDY